MQSVVQLVCELLLKGSLLKLEAVTVFLLPNLVDSLYDKSMQKRTHLVLKLSLEKFSCENGK